MPERLSVARRDARIGATFRSATGTNLPFTGSPLSFVTPDSCFVTFSWPGNGRAGHPSPMGKGQSPAWLPRVRALVETSGPRRPSVAHLARMASVHPAHLGRVFRAHVGCSPIAYMQELRVVMACRLLRESDLSLTQVALRLGFFDQSHFTRIFRARVGLTPGAYRARSRQGGSDVLPPHLSTRRPS